MPTVIRHGDVILRKMNPPNLGIHITERRKLEIAGENGHPHTVKDGVVITTVDRRELLQLDQQTEITHDEHAALQLATGTYSVERVRSYRRSVVTD